MMHGIMRIGLISDTHSFLDDRVFAYFEACDEIWHAGDVGDPAILSKLCQFRPTIAVYGNIDDPAAIDAPEIQVLQRESKRFLMIHIAGKPPRYNVNVRELLQSLEKDHLHPVW